MMLRVLIVEIEQMPLRLILDCCNKFFELSQFLLDLVVEQRIALAVSLPVFLLQLVHFPHYFDDATEGIRSLRGTVSLFNGPLGVQSDSVVVFLILLVGPFPLLLRG